MLSNADFDELLEKLLEMATMLLKEQGEFYPFGIVMWVDGSVQYMAAKTEGDDHPPPQSLLDFLTESFRTRASEGKLRAAGICFDGLTVPPGKKRKQDAICCGLEHCLGQTMDVLTPYTKMESGNLQLGKAFEAERVPRFFCELPQA